MPRQTPVAQVIADWQKRLLQLDRRNNLLYFKPGRIAVSLHVSPPEVDTWIDGSTARWRFAHAQRIGDDVRVTPGDIETEIEPLDLQRRLKALRRKDREWENEQGLNVLFLAVGFLRWIDEDGQAARSPLTLLPCDLERASPRTAFHLKREDDTAEANATLAHQLRTFDLTLPDVQEQRLSEYLEEVRQAIRGKADWAVEDEVALSTFAYSKLAMYEDLGRMRTEGVDHPLVLQLAGAAPPAGTGNDRSTPSAMPPDGDLHGGRLDDLLALNDQFTVVDADFSQLRAIETARRGDAHLVVHGPPGTGKSQTIVNLVATLLADGKRVLFVSEKTAALDVVKRRLDECGLGVFCLDLHSGRAKRSSVYAQLKESLDDPRHVPDSTLSLKVLEDRRTRLNRFVRALHQTRTLLGRTAFEMQGQYAQVLDAPNVDFTIGRIEELDEQRLADIEDGAAHIAIRPDEFREHATNRWIPLKAASPSMELSERIRKRMQRVIAVVKTATSRTESIAEWAGVPTPPTAQACGTTAALLDNLAKGRGVPSHWLDQGTLSKLRRLALIRERQQAARKKLDTTAAQVYGGSRPPADYRSIVAALQRATAEASAIEHLLGVEWPRRIMSVLDSRSDERAAKPVRHVRELEEAATEAVRAAQRLASVASSGARGRSTLLRNPNAATARELSEAVQLAERLVRLYPAPPAWLDAAQEEQAQRDVARLEHHITSLREAETRFPQEFEVRLVEIVNRDMRDRYRTDYQSWWRRLGGSWRRDQRTLRAELRDPRKLSLDESRQAVERAFKVNELRRKWAAAEPGHRERLGARLQGLETDLEQLAKDLEETIALRRGGIGARALRRLLTEEDSHVELQEAVAAGHGALTRLASAVEEIERPDLIEGALPLTALITRAQRALPPLEALADATGDLAGRCHQPPKDIQALEGLVDDMVRLEEIEREDEELGPGLKADFGVRFAGADTDWSAVKAAIEWTRQTLEDAPGHLTERLKAHVTEPLAQAAYVENAEELRAVGREVLDVLDQVGEDFDAGRTQWRAWCAAPFAELRQWAGDLSQHAPSATGWIEYRSAVSNLEREIGADAATRIRAATNEAEEVPRIVRRRICLAWLDHVYGSDPEFSGFSAKDHEHTREQFQQLDRDLMQAARSRVRERCFERYPDRWATHAQAGQIGALKGEISKSRRRMPVRTLLRRIPNVLQALKPCTLMSPLAVSQYLPRGELQAKTVDFDVVVFDEASQVFPEDAVPAIARARRTIVAGDKKQLPPTSFFRRAREDSDDPEALNEEGDDPDQTAGRESILDAMVGMLGAGVAEQHLTIHYRSRQENLIRYSNHYFYEDRLLTFPTPGRNDDAPGVRGVYLSHGRFDAGASRTNRVEAEEVVRRVFSTMRSRPARESLGVVALSRAQADLIERLVDERRLEERDLDQRFREDQPECFFVKNLENVQGDERDHIILSIGYGPTTAPGAVPQRFGPINFEHGERRLNVAVSRARRSMTVVHSLRPQDITETARHDGPRLLRRYLEYLRSPDRAFESQAASDPDSEPEAPFEDAVKRALDQRGHRVVSQVGVSGYRIDLGIASVNGAGFDLGVECDGATYHSAAAARDRDRLRQGVLEGLGWRIHRVWSTAWTRDPDAELAAIERALSLARASARPPRDEGGGSDTPCPPAPDSTDSLPSDEGAEPDPSEPSLLFDEYEEASLADIRIGDELLSETRQTMAALAQRVVETEGPVHLDLVVRRIRKRYSLGKAGHLIRERIKCEATEAVRSKHLDWEGGRERGFLCIPGKPATPRRPPTGVAPRKINHIANSELEAGIRLISDRLYGCERNDLIKQAARQFGFKKTGRHIRQRMGEAVDRLERQGLLNLDPNDRK